MAQGRGKPPVGPGPVVASGCPVSEICRAASAAVAGAPHHAAVDLSSPMAELDADQPSADESSPPLRADLFSFIGDGDARRLGAGIEAQLHARDRRARTASVLEPDGEGSPPGHDGTPTAEQLAGTGGMARHQRLSPFRQNEHPACRRAGSVTAPGLCRRRRRSGTSGVSPSRPGADRAGLPSPMSHTGARLWARESVSRFVPAPRGVCARGFQSRLLRKHSLVGLLTCEERSHRGTSTDPETVMTRAGHSV